MNAATAASFRIIDSHTVVLRSLSDDEMSEEERAVPYTTSPLDGYRGAEQTQRGRKYRRSVRNVEHKKNA